MPEKVPMAIGHEPAGGSVYSSDAEDMAHFGKRAQLKVCDARSTRKGVLNTISLQRIFSLVHAVGFTCCLVITWEAMLVSVAQERLKSIVNGAQSFWRRPSKRRKRGPHLRVYLCLDWDNSASRSHGRNGLNVGTLCFFPRTTQLTRPQQDPARWRSIQLVSTISTKCDSSLFR